MDVELNSAAESGDQEKLSSLLEIVEPPLEKEGWLRKALLRATYEGKDQLVLTLLNVKADPGWVDERREAALHWASRRGHDEVANHLLVFNAHVNQQTQDGSTALHLAAEKNSPSIVALLLAYKADPGLITREKRTALHVAAENGCDEAVPKLLDPVDPTSDEPIPWLNMTNDRGEAPLARAAMRGHAAVVKQILGARADMEAKNWWGQGPLQLACHGGHTSCVQALLGRGAEVNECAQDGTTPLHMACEKGHAKVVEMLLLNKGAMDNRACGGRAPVHCAAARGSAEVMKVLTKYKVKLEDRNEEGRTPLCIAAGRGHANACRVLLEKHADPQALDSVRQTPLHAAAANGQVDCVELLLDYRTRMDGQDAAARSPIMLAHANQQEAVVRLMLKRGAILPDNLDNAASGMGDVVGEVERERLEEMLQESSEGKSASLMTVATRNFEDGRQRLLELTGRMAGSRTAPAIRHLETMLSNTTANYRTTTQIERQVAGEVAQFRELNAAADAKQLQAEKDLKACKDREVKAKSTMATKKASVIDMKKQLVEVSKALKDSLQASSKLDEPVVGSNGKVELSKGEVRKLEYEESSLAAQIAVVTTKLNEWHDMRSQAAIIHAKTQNLLSRNVPGTPAETTPRD